MAITSGWEFESELTVGYNTQYYGYPSAQYNLRGDLKTTMIVGMEVGSFHGYYWDGTKWVKDNTLVTGLVNNGWNEAPYIYYDSVTSRWICITHQGSFTTGKFYGYYWNGASWVQDSLIVTGLPMIEERTTHVVLDNVFGDGQRYLISGTITTGFRAFYWNSTLLTWVEDSAKVNGLIANSKITRVAGGYNVFGNNRWSLIVSGYSPSLLKVYYWDNISLSWIEDTEKEKGLDLRGYNRAAPCITYNLRNDNKWVLLCGITKTYSIFAYYYTSVDTALMPAIINVSTPRVMATTATIRFSFSESWDYDIEYSKFADMRSSSFAGLSRDLKGTIEYFIRNMEPSTTYYFRIYAYVPWDYNYYSMIQNISLTTMPSQGLIQVSPGQSIQDAIEMLPLTGGTVQIMNGVHTPPNVIWSWADNVDIVGESRDGTVIEGYGIYISKFEDYAARKNWMDSNSMKEKKFYDYSDSTPQDFVQNCTVRDLTMHNSIIAYSSSDFYTRFIAVCFFQANNSKISNVKVYNDAPMTQLSNTRGIAMYYTRDSSVESNDVSKVSVGIFLWSPHNINTLYNNIYNTWEGIEYNGNFPRNIPTIIKGNTVTNTTSNGMFLYSMRKYFVPGDIGAIISENIVIGSVGTQYANDGVTNIISGMYLLLSSDHVITNNVIYNCSNGIGMSSNNNYTPPILGNWKNQFYNNLIFNNLLNGMFFYESVGGVEHSQNNIVHSNTIIGNGKDGIDNTRGNDINAKNNIIVKNVRYGINGINSMSSYNDIWSNALLDYNNTVPGIGDISSDPLFADELSADFHLRSQYGRWTPTGRVIDSVTSPCIGTGDPVSDNSKSPFGGVIEIGAFGNTLESSAGTILPPLPQKGNLVVSTSPVPGDIYVGGVLYGNGSISEPLDIGLYTVSFGDISGYITPPAQQVDIIENQTTTITGNYIEIPPIPPGSSDGTIAVGLALIGLGAAYLLRKRKR